MNVTGLMDWLASVPSAYLTGTIWAVAGILGLGTVIAAVRILSYTGRESARGWRIPQPPPPRPSLPSAAPVAIDSTWKGWGTGEFQQALVLHADQQRREYANGNGKVSGAGTWPVLTTADFEKAEQEAERLRRHEETRQAVERAREVPPH